MMYDNACKFHKANSLFTNNLLTYLFYHLFGAAEKFTFLNNINNFLGYQYLSHSSRQPKSNAHNQRNKISDRSRLMKGLTSKWISSN